MGIITAARTGPAGVFPRMAGSVETFGARVTDGVVHQRAPVRHAETRRTA